MFQWIIFRKYIPSIVTSFFVLPYCVYTFIKINEWGILSKYEQIIWGFLGFLIVIVNLIIVHFLIKKIEKSN
ncbi:hypothetical protein [Riemerella anatipestifer]|uniref:hypothetical protein n=1 Tax=Riemerella anatipestifer TaxID=34085 RepID=UPI00374E0BAE